MSGNTNLERIVDDLSSLSLMDAAKLVTVLKEKWNISDMQMMPAAAASRGADAGSENAAAAKTEFDVVLVSMGESKLKVISVVRKVLKELNGGQEVDLPTAKKLVESAPQVLKEGVSKEAAEKAKTEIEAEGAKVELK